MLYINHVAEVKKQINSKSNIESCKENVINLNEYLITLITL